MRAPRHPYISLEGEAVDTTPKPDVPQKKGLLHYLPFIWLVVLLFAPHPSLIVVLVRHHIQLLHKPFQALAHAIVIYGLNFIAIASMLVCVVRDPGPVTLETSHEDREGNDGLELSQALLDPAIDEFQEPRKWCRTCQVSKPERAHHCSQCGRCVLKMDHHCPWLLGCIGHRTYTSFVLFLCSVTLLASYIAVVAGQALWYSFNNADVVDESTGLHELGLFFAGIVFTMVISTFAIYHLYLITTNQTTLENISPYILLRHLPPLPPTLHNFSHLSSPPKDHELTYRQRYTVKDAHHYIRLYDIGWRGNWGEVFGWTKPYGWVERLFIGGACKGDGRTFPRNPRADILLERLAQALVKADEEG